MIFLKIATNRGQAISLEFGRAASVVPEYQATSSIMHYLNPPVPNGKLGDSAKSIILDIVFDASGGFWFTDLGKTYGRLMDRGAVYYARADGSRIKEAIFPILTPNGIGLSPDGRTLYVSETETSRLWSFPITGEGEVGKEPWPSPNGGRLVHGLPGYQRFDSLAVEAGGNICVATLVRGGVSVFSPAGDLVEFHEAPEVYCTNICFGGADMRTAFLTLSGTGQLIAVDWPRAGLPLHDRLTARMR